MATHAATMSSTFSPTYARESDSFMRKLTIVLLLVVNASLGIVLWFRVNSDLPLILPTFFADATIGMVAGYGSRITFRNWNLATHYVAAILAVIVGMSLVGSLTKSVLGVGPFSLQPETKNQLRSLSFDSTLPSQLRDLKIDPATTFDFSKMNASDAAHLAVSLLLAAMSLQAWRGAARQVIEVEPLGHAQVEVEPRAVGVSLGLAESHEPRIHQPVTWFRSPGVSAAPRPRIRTKKWTKSAARSEAKATSSRRSRSRRKPKIQLAVVEEHRCPYCLDPVMRNDSRGVQECEVCHALHHADCWAITGFCQVPHLNS